jgi:hypothetical protein
MKVTTPKLICNITGNARVTTREYLDARIKALGCSEQHFLDNYVSKDAMKKLRAGATVAQIRKEMNSTCIAPITEADIKEFLRLNGKQKGGSTGPAISSRELKARQEAEKAASTSVAKVGAPAASKATAGAAK